MGEPDDEAVLPFFYRYWCVSLLVFSLGHCPAGNTPGRRDIAGAFRYGLEENQAQIESEVLFCREAVSVIPLPVVSARNGDSHLRTDPVFQVDPGLEGIHSLGCFRTHILDMEETGIRSDYNP